MPNRQRSDQGHKLAALETKRRRLGLSLEGLAARSGVPLRKLYRMRRAGRGQESDIRKLTFALRAAGRDVPAECAAFGGGASSLQVAARLAYAGIFAAVAARVPEDHSRKVALYLLVAGANVPSATAGRVYGCSKQYVSKAMRQVEDLREDPEVNRILSELEGQLFPEAR